MNQIKISGTVYNIRQLKSCRSLRLGFRNNINQFRFVDVMFRNDDVINERDTVDIEGNLSVMEPREQDKVKVDRVFIWAEKITPNGQTNTVKTTPEVKEEKTKKTRVKKEAPEAHEETVTERVPF